MEDTSQKRSYVCTFKYYDSKHRRLTICALKEGNNLKITVLTLSDTPEVTVKTVRNNKKRIYHEEHNYDVFSKKGGRLKYEKDCLGTNFKEGCPGHTYDLPLNEEDGLHATFFKWCNERYYRQDRKKVTVEKISYVKGSKWVNPKLVKKEEETTTSESTSTTAE